MPVKMNEREYRSMNLSGSAEEEKLIVEGYATTFNQPYLLYEFDGVKYFEVIDRHALDDADMSDVIMQYDHDGKVLARNRNNTLEVIPQEAGLYIRADLSGSKAAQELYQEIKSGLIDRMSWAFTVEEESYNSDTRTRTITKIKKVYDVSAVSIPANDNTNISCRNFVETERMKAKQVEQLEARKRILKLKMEMEN